MAWRGLGLLRPSQGSSSGRGVDGDEFGRFGDPWKQRYWCWCMSNGNPVMIFMFIYLFIFKKRVNFQHLETGKGSGLCGYLGHGR